MGLDAAVKTALRIAWVTAMAAAIAVGLAIPVLAGVGALSNPAGPSLAGGSEAGQAASAAASTAAATVSAFVTVADPDDDADGLVLSLEITNGCLDTDPDSDDDGLTDGQEFILLGTDCNGADTDGDGFTDAFEMTLTGTATGASSTTLVDTDSSYPQPPASPNSTWATNQWTGFFVTITGGAGAGQTRAIVGNTADTLSITPATPWTTIPNATSTYGIQKVGTDPLVACAADSIADNEDPDPLPPDINDDRSVNILDVFKMVDSWLVNVTDPSFDPRMDLNTDSGVNVLDVFQMFPLWLQTCTP